MLIKKHEKYELEETTTSKDNEPCKSVSAIRTVHELTDTERGIFDRDCETKFNQNHKPNRIDFNQNQLTTSIDSDRSNRSKVYFPSDDKMDLDHLIKQSTGKKYSSSWFYGDSSKNPYPTIEEQVKLCRKIASQLVDDENRKSKGASMFFKRLKRSQKWIHEGNCNSSDNLMSPTNGNGVQAEQEMQRLKHELKSDTIPRLKLILDPREVLSLEKLRKTGDIVEHNIVSPDVCHNLVKDLNSPEANKGAQIFLKRKEKSEEWVVDENSCTTQLREKKREKELQAQQQENAQKEWLARKQKEKMNELEQLENIQRSLPKIKLVKSPWEASLEGNVEQAFQVPASKFKPESTIQIDCTKLQAINSNANKDYKNFNRNPRGWGASLQEEYEQRSNSALSLKSISPSIPQSISPLPPMSDHQIPIDFELPRSFTVMEELKQLQKPKCAEFGLPQIDKRAQHSILKDGRKVNLHRSNTVNFKLDDDRRPAVHFNLKNLHINDVKLPKFKNFNSVPKVWSREPISYF